MRIYIDFDDVLCDTATRLLEVGGELFGKKVHYRDVRDFNLQVTFSLSDDESLELMAATHTPEFLLGLKEIPGAIDVVRGWLTAGHEVVIVTGRPVSTAASSRRWLAERGLHEVGLMHVDKYGRFHYWPLPEGENRAFTAKELQQQHFDWAIEDSPTGLDLLREMPMRVIIFDRPWNVNYKPSANMTRCDLWSKIGEMVG